jgi:hypothetical protein
LLFLSNRKKKPKIATLLIGVSCQSDKTIVPTHFSEDYVGILLMLMVVGVLVAVVATSFGMMR